MKANPAWLTSAEASALCFGISAQTLRRWADAGKFPLFVRTPGGQFRIRADHVERFLEWKAECARADREGRPVPPAPEWPDPLEPINEPSEADCAV